MSQTKAELLAGRDSPLTFPSGNGTAGQYLQGDGAGALSWQTVTSTSVAVIADVKAQNTAGGTFTAGAWRTRDLNTEISDPDGIVTIASNQFTLGAGTYLIHWECPAYRVNSHQSRLWDVTGSAVVENGMTRYDETTTIVGGISPGSAVVSPTANRTYEIQHICNGGKTTNGFGVEGNLAQERYTRVTIWKVA